MSACGKVRHPTVRKARRAARALGIPGWLRAYECPRCKGWHLTSEPVPGIRWKGAE